MLKKYAILLIIVGIVTQTNFSWGKNYNFRHTIWGMTQDEVIASETLVPIEKKENYIKYKTQNIE